ncbi:MAG TPA: hypothetical protein VK894_08540 [Jiangellales bacterium]|nr:hypothetical protein [Jiangellales bacterium]
MLWVFLSALANRWLWLFAVFATAVLLVLPGIPVGFALGAGLVVLGAGAGADALGQVRRARRRLPGGERPAVRARVRDPEAAAHIRRAEAGTERLERAQQAFGEGQAELTADVGVHAGQMLDALHATGRQVDRLDAMLSGVDPGALGQELAEVQRLLASQPAAPAELTAQRRRSADGLGAQLAAYRRVSEQRALMLERMRATAVGIEGLAVRVGEIGALYESSGQVDTSDEDLRVVSSEIEGLREALVEAERSVRAALDSTDLPGIPDVPEPPPAGPVR